MPSVKEKKTNKIRSNNEFDTATYLYWLKSMVLMRRFEEMAGRLYGDHFLHIMIGVE